MADAGGSGSSPCSLSDSGVRPVASSACVSAATAAMFATAGGVASGKNGREAGVDAAATGPGTEYGRAARTDASGPAPPPGVSPQV